MTNEKFENESIELSLPLNAAYVSSARLTASSIANRLGFDIDEIEDVKAAVSEACTFVIKKCVSQSKSFKIIFVVSSGYLRTTLSIDGLVDLSITDDELSLLMIKALVDVMEIANREDNQFVLEMTKTHKQKSFD